MSDAEWNEEVERYRKEGLDNLSESRRTLRQSSVWRARLTEIKQHVEWLFRRITLPYPLPEQMVEDYPGVSVYTIRTANMKTAKLLGLEIPRGRRRVRGRYQREA